jgi:SAM-dependent methyltransferase
MPFSPPRPRDTFEDVADSYDSARPPYPEHLVDDVLAYVAIGPNTRVLEIGCGPGLFTVPLARSGAQVLALELGHKLAAVASQRLQPWSNASVQVVDFDLWSAPDGLFDVVVVATAFHWLDPTQRLQKCYAALKPEGVLAIVDTHWGVGHQVAEFSLAIQPCYATHDPNHQPGFVPQIVRDLPSEHRELLDSRLFKTVHLKRYTVSRHYSADQFCNLLNTYSDVRAFPPDARAGFLACVRKLIVSDYAGAIERSDSYSLWLGHRLP